MNYSISIISISEVKFGIWFNLVFQFLHLIDTLKKQKSVMDILLINYWFKPVWASFYPKNFIHTSKDITKS